MCICTSICIPYSRVMGVVAYIYIYIYTNSKYMYVQTYIKGINESTLGFLVLKEVFIHDVRMTNKG